MEDNVNPQEGTVEHIAQVLLEKSAPSETSEKHVTEPQEDTPEQVDEEGDEEALEEIDEVESDEDTEDDSQPQMVTVKIDGKSVEVPLEEALAGYQKDQDYRKKTAELAEKRKEVEALKEKVSDLPAVRENYLAELKILQELTAAPIFTDEKLAEILQTKGAEAYLQAKAAQEKHQQKQDVLRQKISTVENEVTEEQKQQLAQRETAERELLFKAVPELQDDTRRKALGSYILNLGYTEDDVKGTLDHRLFVVMEKARQFDELMAKGKQKPVVNIPKVSKGEASRKSGSELKVGRIQELSKQAKRTGSVEDMARLLLEKRK